MDVNRGVETRIGIGTVTVLQYWHMALTAVATVYIGNSVH